MPLGISNSVLLGTSDWPNSDDLLKILVIYRSSHMLFEKKDESLCVREWRRFEKERKTYEGEGGGEKRPFLYVHVDRQLRSLLNILNML